jgi:hypothetical protein
MITGKMVGDCEPGGGEGGVGACGGGGWEDQTRFNRQLALRFFR